MTRHAAIRAASTDPCPFCGCGTALGAHKPARKASRRPRVQEDRSGWPSLFEGPHAHPRSLFVAHAGPVPGAAAAQASWDAHRARGDRLYLTAANTAEWKPSSTEEVAA